MSAAHFAFLLGKLRVGGAERIVVEIANELARGGDRVDLVLVEGGGALADAVPPGVRVVELGLPATLVALPMLLRRLPAGMVFGKGTPRVLRATGRLRRYLRDEQPDALLASLRGPSLMAIWAGAQTRTRIVVRLANHATGEAARESAPFKHDHPELIRRFYPQADRVIALSHEMANDLVTNVGLERSAIDVIPNPVPIDRIAALAKEDPERGWPSDGSRPAIVAAGRLAPQKDHATLLRAFAVLRRTHDADLVILGDGDLRAELQSLSGSFGIADRVSFPGRVENPHAYFARASVFALPSIFEGFPNVLLEALASGCPVVATDCPSGPSEIVTRREFGELVPMGDPDALAQALAQVLDNPRDATVLRAHAASFSTKDAVARYRQAMLGPDPVRQM